MKRILFTLPFLVGLAFAGPVRAAGDGELIKASGPAVYYASGGKRYVFPNEKIYFSWYRDFSGVRTVSDTELASHLIGGNVTYKPGVRLIKLQTDPKVYAVGAGGRLRWIATEEAAKSLYGAQWNKQVDDVSDAYFVDYREGDPIASAADFDPIAESSTPDITADLAARAGAASAEVQAGPVVATRLGQWTDTATWGGRRPAAGSSVVIPPGIKVVYDAADSGSLKSLDIQGTLEFWPQTSLRLASRMITVSGKLAVGSEAQPFPADKTATIVLTGASSQALTDDGLRVNGGTLDLHGAAAATWTRLASPAKKGDDRLVLEKPVDWKPGAEIIIAPTSDDPKEAETRRVAEVKGDIVILETPLSHAHRAEEGIGAEVGLLTRNVVVSGVSPTQGGYVVLTGNAVGRIENVEFRDLGRSGVRGQYPLFFDGLMTGSASYVRNNAIHDSGNRCVVLRQVDKLAVTDNVASSVSGHCFVMEDGAESGDVFAGNLAVSVGAGTAATGDAVPAAFLLRTPDANLEGNVAAGGEGHGFWLDLPAEAVKNNGLRLRPREIALGVFSNNVAHSNLKNGLYADDVQGRMNYNPPRKASFAGFTAAVNGERGFWLRGSNLEVIGARLTENPIGGTFAAFAATLKDSTIVGGPRARYGFTFYDGPVAVSNVTFMDFTPDEDRPSAALGFHENNDRLPDPRSSYKNVKFENARPWYAPDPEKLGDRLAAVRDLDAGTTITANSPFLNEGCSRDDAGNVSVCPGKFAQLVLALRDAPGNRSVTVEKTDNAAQVTFVPGPAFDGEYAYVTAAEGAAYRAVLPPASRVSVEYDGAEQPVTLRFKTSPAVAVAGLPAEAWSYDPAKGETVLNLAPGASGDVSW